MNVMSMFQLNSGHCKNTVWQEYPSSNLCDVMSLTVKIRFVLACRKGGIGEMDMGLLWLAVEI